MEVNGHVTQMLLLSLMIVSASYAWHGKRICPKQWLPVGGDCSRYREYCPTGAVCERLGPNHKCKIGFGNHCTSSKQCVASALCIQNECRIPAGVSGCGTDDDKCVTHAICVSDICRIPVGFSGCEDNSAKCVTSAVCESNTCKLPAGSQGCSSSSSLCLSSTVCQSDTCNIIYGLNCTNDEDHCQDQGVCESGLCGCPPLPDNPDGVITSSNYPDFHDHGENTTSSITASEGQVIRMEFAFFSLEVDMYCAIDENPLGTDCSYDYIYLEDGVSPPRKQCGTGCPQPYLSQSNVVTLTFITDDVYRCKGFKIMYYFVSVI